jgi:Fe-S cluster biosynthesis and repair protein YggX
MDQQQLQQRIAQWEKMTAEAPDGMSYFSLGNAYKDAERHGEAARALRKAIEMDPTLSRAYQLLAQVLIKEGADQQAGEVLTTGYTVAAQRGDVMPQRAMGSLLEKLGLPVPQVAQQAPTVVAEGDSIVDRRSGEPGPRLKAAPMRGPVGRFIQDHYSQTTWSQWIGQGTKVINELRLDFSNRAHQAVYDTHMMEWLGFTMEEVEEYERSRK